MEPSLEKIRVAPHAVAQFARQLSILMASGVPVHASLEALSTQADDPQFQLILENVAAEVSSGHRLSTSFARFPRVFPRVLQVMVKVGEADGSLVDSLVVVSDWMDREDEVKRKIKSAMTYPAAVLALTGCMTLALFTTVLPQFLSIFEDLRVELPLITRVVVWVTGFVQNPGVWILGVVLLLQGYYGLRAAWSRPKSAARLFEHLRRVPLVGDLLNRVTHTRFVDVAANLLNTGIDMVTALGLAAQASGSPSLRLDHARVRGEIEAGERVADALQARPDLYLATLVHMVQAGEEVGRIPEMLEKVRDILNDEVNCRVETLGATLEPVLLFLVAGILGVVLLAIFLPLYSVMGNF